MGKNKTMLRKEVYDKYVAPARQMDKDRKNANRKKWWSQNIFNIISVAIAIIALIISIVK